MPSGGGSKLGKPTTWPTGPRARKLFGYFAALAVVVALLSIVVSLPCCFISVVAGLLLVCCFVGLLGFAALLLY